MNRSLTLEQKHALHGLGDAIDKVLDGDRAFFRRFPHRAYRVRLASQPENAACAIFDSPEIPDGYARYVAVRQFAAGVRGRVPFLAPKGRGTDIPEDLARTVYEQFTQHPKVQKLQRDLIATLRSARPA